MKGPVSEQRLDSYCVAVRIRRQAKRGSSICGRNCQFAGAQLQGIQYRYVQLHAFFSAHIAMGPSFQVLAAAGPHFFEFGKASVEYSQISLLLRISMKTSIIFNSKPASDSDRRPPPKALHSHPLHPSVRTVRSCVNQIMPTPSLHLSPTCFNERQ